MLASPRPDFGKRLSILPDWSYRESTIAQDLLVGRGRGIVTPRRLHALESLVNALRECCRITGTYDKKCGVAVSTRHRSYKNMPVTSEDTEWAVDRLVKSQLASRWVGKQVAKKCSRLYPTFVIEKLFQSILPVTQYSEIRSYKSVKKVSKISDLEAEPLVGEEYDNLFAINTANSKHTYTYSPPHTVTRRCSQLISLTFDKIKCRRGVSKQPDLGFGRFYASVQSLRRVERKSIRIDGQETVELDFGSLYVNIAYHSLGLQLREDPYYLPELNTLQRKAGKKSFLSLIGAPSRKKAKASIQHMVNQGILDLGHITTDDLIDSIVVANKPIEQYFFQDKSLWFQCVESRIANAIMMQFASRDKPILGIHDSFLVKAEDSSLLRQTMAEQYQLVMSKVSNKYTVGCPKIGTK